MFKSLSQLALLAAALALLCCLAAADDFTYGRGTFYDDNQDGACRYGTNIPEWYAAWPDGQEGAPNCGACFELACVDQDFHDGYGEKIHRSGVCKDEKKTVTVKIVDSCPCVHANFYSNKRWCCGDMRHIDIGRKAFKELASEEWGVIAIKWRKVDCSKLGPGRM